MPARRSSWAPRARTAAALRCRPSPRAPASPQCTAPRSAAAPWSWIGTGRSAKLRATRAARLLNESASGFGVSRSSMCVTTRNVSLACSPLAGRHRPARSTSDVESGESDNVQHSISGSVLAGSCAVLGQSICTAALNCLASVPVARCSRAGRCQPRRCGTRPAQSQAGAAAPNKRPARSRASSL